jgi:hypothetical protein
MLQPRKYPEMLGKALVLEAEPFIDMVEDDEPWAEGLFMVVSMGVLVGIAQIAGALLTSAIMPEPQALYTTLLPVWNQLTALFGQAGSAGTDADAWLRTLWPTGVGMFGIGWSWVQLGWIVLAPFLLVAQWLLFALIAHGVARAIGGSGRLSQTMGATALIVAPQIFVLLEVIPFASVSFMLVSAWALLIVYRAIEVAHELPWLRAAAAALATPALLVLLVLFGLTTLAVLSVIVGGVA